jgi:Outer membrane protein beta-barrel domain
MKFICLIAAVFISSLVFSQKEKPKNYRKFDEKWLHFGFMLGINSSNFKVTPRVDAYSQYGLKSVVSTKTPGGQVGIVTSLKLGTPVVRLRFIPTLSFQEKVLNYSFVNPDPAAKTDKLLEERVNSTNLDFPLMFQFRTMRLNNFTAYALGGAQYSYDLQSQEDASQSFIDPFIKIKANDWQGQVGAGLEWFAVYFKFSFEVKYSFGVYNVFIQDGTNVSKPIDQLRNRAVWFSIIFEG